MAARLCALSLIATLVAGIALAADYPIPGKVTVIKAAKVAKFVSKNKPILPALFPTPAPGSLADPTLHGAELRFFDTRLNGAGEFVHTLPANGWTRARQPAGIARLQIPGLQRSRPALQDRPDQGQGDQGDLQVAGDTARSALHRRGRR
jgi:hypothetical protein